MPTTETPSRRVLVVDDEKEVRVMMTHMLRGAGLAPLEAETGEQALRLLRREPADVMLLDLQLPGTGGLDVLREARRIDTELPVILVTASGSLDSAVEAGRRGAFDYLTKPFRSEQLLHTVRSALQRRQPGDRSPTDSPSLEELMGPGEAVRRLRREVERVAPTNFTVVVSGETGSGKELVAREIHRLSRRASGPFVPVDCGAIQPALVESELFGHEKGSFTGADRVRAGRFEAAHGGTLFLDEMQNLPLEVQAKLLRALQERQFCRVGGGRPQEVDVRVVATANEDLQELVAAERFRLDLFHRLNEFPLRVPPLRERPEDLVHLTRRFCEQTCAELGKEIHKISAEAIERLRCHPWPGNVRELRNVVRRAVLLADDQIGPEHLALTRVPVAVVPADEPMAEAEEANDVGGGLKERVRHRMARVEREILQQTLKETGGNKAKAARLLQVDYKTLLTKARQHGLLTRGEDRLNLDPTL